MFLSLVSVLTLTGGLLMLTRSAPLAPDTSRSLLATNSPGNLEPVFDTKVPVKLGRWKRVFIHHSQSASGNAATLAEAAATTSAGGGGPADHFVIGNGAGCGDGELQLGQRWNPQRPAGAIGGWGGGGRNAFASGVPTTAKVESDCISICLIGDFDHAFPTPAQMERLGQLVTTLQGRLGINKDAVWVWETPASPIGIGRYFPQGAFRERLLR